MWNDALGREPRTKILDLILDTYNLGFTNNDQLIKNYLRPAGVSYEIIRTHKNSNDIVRNIIDSLTGEEKSRVVRSLLYRLLYIHKEGRENQDIKNEGKEKLSQLVNLISELDIHPIYLNEIEETEEPLSLDEFRECLKTSFNLIEHVIDRRNLHGRDVYERFNNILMGEIAESLVIKWLHKNEKYAESAVDKTSGHPDLGHDINLKDSQGNIIKCSVKSSLAAFRNPREILLESKLASTQKEIKEVNIQVYFWYNLYPQGKGYSRITLPNTNNVALFSWAKDEDIQEFRKYASEKRTSSERPLCELRKMEDLLKIIQ